MNSNKDTSASTGQLSSASSVGGGMHHSLSTPIGVDGGGSRTPPTTPKKYGKMLAIRVQLLDDTVTIIQVQSKALGNVLFEQVCKQLHLLEADYFGLEYQDIHGTRYWLDLQKPISRQLGLSLVDPLLQFCVKFYTPDPSQLEEEYTRYLFCLQVKRDLAQGHLQCNDNTAALMASYIVQAECGDFVAEDYPDHTYLNSYKFVPHQDHEMERKIMEKHKKHIGQSPAEADLNLLETARRCELYGIKMHPAKDHENVPLNLAVAHMGIIVFQHYTKINTFSWAKIRKISFKRKRFLIKLHPEGYGYYKDIVEFFFEGRNECKNFWKKCVENHGFFRCSSVKTIPRHKTRVLSRGSSFRYSGKTQKEIVEFVRDNYVKRQAFQRSASFRHTSSHSSSANMHASSVGNSISAHPLLPLSDHILTAEVSIRSASLASMDEPRRTTLDSPTTKSASLPQGTVMSWTSTKNSPSPPLTMPLVSPVTSATASPPPSPTEDQEPQQGSLTMYTNTGKFQNGVEIQTKTGTIFDRTISNNYKSDSKLDTAVQTSFSPQNTINDDSHYTYNVCAKRTVWHRSSSCRELNDYSFEESGKTKRKSSYVQNRILESPITRYDDHRLVYDSSRNNSLEIHQDIMVPDQKIYSSSYPGTATYSQESVEDPGNYDLRDSQDEITHDSYEVVDRSDEDITCTHRYKNKFYNVRSCSLDSSNYPPSDLESEGEQKVKCKSSSDITFESYAFDDPRYYPREKMPRKSDGSFYKSIKAYSRTSSLESKNSDYEVKTTRRRKSKDRSSVSRTSSQDSSKNYEYEVDYYKNMVNSHEFDRKIPFERNYGTQKKQIQTVPINEVSHNNHVVPQTPQDTIFNFETDKIQTLVLESSDKSKKEYFNDLFVEVQPKKMDYFPIHQTIERTKSDPNSLARQRIGSSSRRHLLMHQKSIDITPAESSDDDYLFRQIPSAPPITTFKGSYFEMPNAEFGHFDILTRDTKGEKTKFDVPKSQFEVLGAKTQSDLVNPLPKTESDIPYILHKRHIMNGTAPKEEQNVEDDVKVGKSPTKVDTDVPESSTFLFTQNIDLSKVNPVTLEVDKSKVSVNHLSSPKRDITRIDPALLEALNTKLSQIESDSPTSSKTESLKPDVKLSKTIHKVPVLLKDDKPKVLQNQVIKSDKGIEPVTTKIINKEKSKPDVKQKKGVKGRVQTKKGVKGNKTKVRITSFSSDDESLDSDDVFGSAEATPTKLEFSPPQTRKEMESILKFEAERKYLQYTMSSTEVEGSPPASRKSEPLHYDRSLDPNFQTELRRISERSFSIPSSEDDLNINTSDLQSVFQEVTTESTLTTVLEVDKEHHLDCGTKDEITEISEGRTEAIFFDQGSDDLLKEKALLQSQIEQDLQDLKVPSKTKITELWSPLSSRKGHSPLLFAHARLNLSEGSAMTLLQKQQATESLFPGRRAKSLDAPVIAIHRLPSSTAFSSKDDTVDDDHLKTLEISELEYTSDEIPPDEVDINKSIIVDKVMKINHSDQIVPDLIPKKVDHLSRESSAEKVPKLPAKSYGDKGAKPARPSKNLPQRSASATLKQTSLTPPEKEVKRAKSQEMETTKKSAPKEKAKSLEKLEFKRINSKERTKSQEEGDTDIVKRKEKQQMLYETAIKQTKALKSPVKEILPVFPQVEESVRERGGKLEISINTIENPSVSLEEAIIITKSPKRLDKKMDKKLTQSLELNSSNNKDEDAESDGKLQRLGKSLDLELRPKENELEFDFNTETVSRIRAEDEEAQSSQNLILEGTSLDVWLSVDKEPEKLGDITIIKKSDDFFEERIKPPDICTNTKSSPSDSTSLGNHLDIQYIDESGDSSKKSDQDNKLITQSEFQKSTSIISKYITKKLERRRQNNEAMQDEINKETRNEFKLEVEHQNGQDKNTKSSEEGQFKMNLSLLSAEDKSLKRMELLKRSSDHSKSSDTGSWTSGEKDSSPGNVRETADDSSTSCIIGQVVGISQNIEKFQMDKNSPEVEVPKSPRSPKICVLGRAFTIDEESYGLQNKSDESISEVNDIPVDSLDFLTVNSKKSKYPFEEKWSDESELGQKVQQKIVKKLTSSDRNSTSSTDEMRKNGVKSSLRGLEKLSADSKSSMDTESSSGSLGFAARLIKGSDSTNTWKPFPLESSGSSSIEEGAFSNGHDKDHEYFVSATKVDDEVTPTSNCEEVKDESIDFSYPSNIGITISGADIFGGYSSTLLGRTLSRISEKSSNSESMEEDSTKASTHLDSLNEESTTSSERNGSLSSDSPSNARKSDSDKKKSSNVEPEKPPNFVETVPNFNSFLLHRQVSDDRRTSAEMAELSIDDIEIITSESGLRLKRQGSDDTVIDEEYLEPEQKLRLVGSSSQESEDWPLPEIPCSESNDKAETKPLFALHDTGSSDASQLTTQVFKPPQVEIPKVFGLRGSLKSQDSEPWPSPPSSIQEPMVVVEKIKTHYVTAEEADIVVVDETLYSAAGDDENSEEEREHIYENVTNANRIRIVMEEKCSDSPGSNSEDVNMSNLNDDVFVDSFEITRMELKVPVIAKRKSTTGSYSEEDYTSSLGTNLEDGTVRFALKPGTKCTHSSHSEDTSIALSLSEWSNSTNTVKIQNLSTSNSAPTKSSSGLKSDDNSLADIAPSLSEWSSSNSNTFMAQQNAAGITFQRLSSSTSTGDSNTLTDFIQSVSEKSSSDTKTLVPQQFFIPRTNISRLGSSVDDLEVPYDQKSLKSPQNIPSEDLAILSSSFPGKVTVPPDLILRTTNGISKGQKWSSTERPVKVPLSKCSPYYSSSLSSESTQMPVSKTATVPLTRSHRKSLSKSSLHHKPPISENDSTSSIDSPKSSIDRRILRRRKQRHKTDKDKSNRDELQLSKSDMGLIESLRRAETLEEGYFPDGDSQSGSDVFRMERDEPNINFNDPRVEEFDVKSIPPPLLEYDLENDSPSTL